MEQENRGKRRKSRPVKPEQAAEERQQAADKRPRGSTPAPEMSIMDEICTRPLALSIWTSI